MIAGSRQPRSHIRTVIAVSLFAIALVVVVLIKHHYYQPSPNVILISIDTLRSDRLGCYGHTVSTSPNIDRFAASEAIIFLDPVAHAPSTLPSHASIFTSLLPCHHGANWSRKTTLPENLETMAEILKASGYRTASFNDGGQVSAKMGLGQGFDVYKEFPDGAIGCKLSRSIKHGLDWIASLEGKSPFFLFLHTYETHIPYTSEPKYYDQIRHVNEGTLQDHISLELIKEINDKKREITQQDEEHIRAAYDAEIRSVDEAFGSFIGTLKERGLYENTIVIFTSDHGEELGEHGMMGWHSHALWDELLEVPLIIKLPDNDMAGVRVARQVRSVDILPTILHALGIEQRPVFEGESLLPLAWTKSNSPRFAVSERDVPEANNPISIRDGKWKYYRRTLNSIDHLFNLEEDPREQMDVLSQYPQEETRLNTILQQIVDSRHIVDAGPAFEDSVELNEKLESLGYIEPDVESDR